MEPTKVVLHYIDGRILKGFTQDFFPNKPTFHFQPADSGNPGGQIEVPVKELKGVFFVKDFAGNPAYKEKKTFPEGMQISGKKVEVTFKDGETLIGSTLGYDSSRPGFFFFPSDPQWNLIRVYIVAQSVVRVRTVQ
jgi:hypothetical protein